MTQPANRNHLWVFAQWVLASLLLLVGVLIIRSAKSSFATSIGWTLAVMVLSGAWLVVVRRHDMQSNPGLSQRAPHLHRALELGGAVTCFALLLSPAYRVPSADTWWALPIGGLIVIAVVAFWRNLPEVKRRYPPKL